MRKAGLPVDPGLGAGFRTPLENVGMGEELHSYRDLDVPVPPPGQGKQQGVDAVLRFTSCQSCRSIP